MKIKRIGLALLMFVGMLASLHVTALAAAKPTSDDYLTDTVRSHLAADAVVKGGNIDVDVKSGVCTLTGKVMESKQKDKAERLAKKVSGVKSVVNKITVEKP